MDATNLPANMTFSDLLRQLRKDFPDVTFARAEVFRWSDDTQTIYYNARGEFPLWSLLHEVGHMVCGHSEYHSDTALVRMEMEAWDSARTFGERYGVVIDEEHIQDCMDSYRSWQHKRSTCPVCSLTGVEKRDGLYICINCAERWHVGDDRFCRVYRKRIAAK